MDFANVFPVISVIVRALSEISAGAASCVVRTPTRLPAKVRHVRNRPAPFG